ncbi:hypothetical protein CPHO_08085 [Corynebacterium phocae]|uniref:Uncharacterized protein n=1 Tax=Corynebacterium phocae TaxID=161895 RepID=A0A1L7D4J9_9CORY|nr:hypothetical protein [Corynebacterium phocae]APT92852.1 hypothetical protein CPHO_08085 [Corynebacterium phocae]KAA8723171.1 hypothetical protein F4V58_07590 [Corynebacterium phocae]
MKNITRRITAGFAASALAVSLVACTQEAQEDVDQALDSAATEVDKAGDKMSKEAAEATAAIASAVEDAGDSMESAAADASAAVVSAGNEADKKMSEAGEGMKMVPGAEGDVELPADFADEAVAKGQEWGLNIEDVQTTDKGTLVNYGDNKLLVHNAETGKTVPVIGKIAETYIENGGLEAEVGLPVEPEQVTDHATGWNQEFTNGTISWMADATGRFGADIRMM